MNNASFGLTAPRQEVLVAKWSQLAVAVILIIVAFSLALVHLWSMRRKTMEELLHVRNRWRIYIFLTTVAAGIAMVFVLVLTAVDWTPSNMGECIIIPNYVAVFFVVHRELSALTLWSRALVVQQGLRLNDVRLKIYRNFIYFNITVGVWIVFGWSLWLNYSGKITPEGVCVFYSKSPGVILSFAILDAILGLAVLLLFAAPLSAHSRQMAGIGRADENRVTDQITYLIRTNFITCLLIIMFDVAGLSTMTGLLLKAGGLEVDPALEYMQIWAVTIPALTSLVCLLLLHSLTLAWLPKRFRAAFKRSEFSFGSHAAAERATPVGPGADQEVLYLGNIYGDDETIQTQIKVRRYTVPFVTVLSTWIGTDLARTLARTSYSHKRLWQISMTSFFAALIAMNIVVLTGQVPGWVGYIVLGCLVVIQVFDNFYSLPVIRLLLRQSSVLVQLAAGLFLAILLCDVVGWDSRSASAMSFFLGFLYITFVDALVGESRAAFLFVVGSLTPVASLSVLILLQWDLIANPVNTLLVFNVTQPYTFSLYLLARDVAALIAFLQVRDGLRILRGHALDWFIRLDGDIAVRVAGINHASKSKQKNANAPASEPKSGPSAMSMGSPAVVDSQPPATMVEEPVKSAVSLSTEDEQNSSKKKSAMNVIELREEDSLFVQVCGISTGSKLLDICTQPWFRLLNEYLLGVPLAVFVALVLPGIVDPSVSFLLLLSLVPFVRNFGLKSHRLLYLILARPSAFMETAMVAASVIFIAISFQSSPMRVLAFHLFVFYLDVRTNDARCVFFHTKTRRGRRMSPVERFLFRLASFLIAGSFTALPILLFLGVSYNTDFSLGFSVVQGAHYPADLSVVLLFQAGSDHVWLMVWKLLVDVYVDLMTRTRNGVKLRHIRAPIAPDFSNSSQVLDSDMRNKVFNATDGSRNDNSSAHQHSAPSAPETAVTLVAVGGDIPPNSESNTS